METIHFFLTEVNTYLNELKGDTSVKYGFKHESFKFLGFFFPSAKIFFLICKTRIFFFYIHSFALIFYVYNYIDI